MIHKRPLNERVAIFIDGANFRKATFEAMEFQVDFEGLLEVLSEGGTLVRAYYYTGEFDADAIEHYVRLDSTAYPEITRDRMRKQLDRDRRFHRWLNRNGYKVVTKGVRIFKNADSEISIKANVDIEIAIDMLTMADKIDRMVLVSGDGDFAPLVDAVASQGVRVVVVTTQNRNAQLNGYNASDLLIDAADEYIPLERIRNRIERNDRFSHEETLRLYGQTLTGVIEEKLDDRGFGFIRSDAGKKIFFHASDLQGMLRFEDIQEDDEVYFELKDERDEKRPYARAKEVRLKLEDAVLEPEHAVMGE